MVNIIKKLTVLVAIIMYSLVLVSCLERVTDQEKIQEVSENLFEDINITNITEDIIFPDEINGVKIKYTSFNNVVISKDGKVTRQDNDVEVLIYITFIYDETEIKSSYSFIVKGLNNTEDPNDDYLEYYQGVENLSGLGLKNFLHNLIDDHRSFSYDYAKTALRETDEDPNNSDNVILFYTGRTQAKSRFGGGADDWNREHVWAKSHGGFGDVAPAGTDLHHLRPTDASVNSTRGNKDFDEGGSKVNDVFGVGSSFSYYDGDSFEPRDEVKGDVARIIFYMAVRYDGSDTSADLELNDSVNNGSSRYMGKLSILLHWNREDPVDDFERNRNEVIYSYQENRNPFIDYPEFADLIWGAELLQLNNNKEVFRGYLELRIINIDIVELKRKHY